MRLGPAARILDGYSGGDGLVDGQGNDLVVRIIEPDAPGELG